MTSIQTVMTSDGRKLEVSPITAEEGKGTQGRYVRLEDDEFRKLDADGRVMLPESQRQDLAEKSGLRRLFNKWTVGIGAPLLLMAGGAANYMRYSSGIPEAEGDYNPDAVVVVTGGEGRVKTGFVTCEKGDRFLISGANRASSVQAIFAACGLDRNQVEISIDDDVDALSNAKTTTGNAKEIAHWLKAHPDVKRVTLVTSAYHKAALMRSCLEHCPDDVEFRMKTVGDYTSTGSKLKATMREIVRFNIDWLGLDLRGDDAHLYEPYDDSTPKNE